MKADKRFARIIILIIFSFSMAYLLGFVFSEQRSFFNNRINDLFVRFKYTLKGSEKKSSNLVLFGINDRFQEKYKYDDSTRDVYGDILNTLHKGKAKTVVFDTIFRKPLPPPGDTKLLQATRRGDNIFYPFVAVNGSGNITNNRHKKILPFFYPEILVEGDPINVKEVILPFDELALAAKGLGSITLTPDSDDINRDIPLLFVSQDVFLPSIVLNGICDYFKISLNNLKISFGRHIKLPSVNLPSGVKKDLYIPIDSRGRMKINFSGPWSDFNSLFSVTPFVDEPASTNFSDLLVDTFCLVIDISIEKKDYSRGIFDKNYPNGAILYNALNTILTENYLYNSNPPEHILFALFFGMIEAFLYYILIRKRKPGLFIPSSLALFFLYVLINFILFTGFNRMPDILSYSLGVVIFLSNCLIFYKKLLILKPVVSLSESDEKTAVSKANLETSGSLKDHLVTKFKLSPKETETALLLLEGLQYKEIASVLNITIHAVRRRIGKVYTKCRVSNKIEFTNKVRGF